MARLRRLSLTLLAVVVLLLSLSSAALAAGGADSGGSSGGGSGGGGGGGGGTGGGGSNGTLCGAITLSAPLVTSYYTGFGGTATNCNTVTTDYVIQMSDVTPNQTAACQLAISSNKKAPMAPGAMSYMYYKFIPCLGDYSVQVDLIQNRQVTASATLNFTYTGTTIVVH